MQKTKRPLSFLLAVLMIVSMFAAVPFTASAEDKVIGENVIFKLGDTIVLPGSGVYYVKAGWHGTQPVSGNGTVTKLEGDDYSYTVEIDGWGINAYLNTFDYWEEMEQGLSVLGITFTGSGTDSDPYMLKLALGEVESTWAGEGEGTEASPWLIKDLNDLRTLSANVASGMTYSGKYLKLAADIDCGSDNWEPIGGDKPFAGTFDGDGKTITYSIICSEDDIPKGLFAKIGSAGTVKNLNVAGSIVNTAEYAGPAGGIAADNNGLIENCYSAVDITKGCDRGTGGIAAYNNEGATIRYCAASGTLTWTGASDFYAYIGGITCQVYESTVTNSTSLCNVLAENAQDSDNYAGIFIGRNVNDYATPECYYLSTAATAGFVNKDGAEPKTPDELKAIGQAAIEEGYTVYGLALGGSLSNPDQEAADAVIALIGAIGTVEYTPESKALIDAARAKYNELTTEQQALVTNIDTLTAAETEYAALEIAASVASVTVGGSTTYYDTFADALTAWTDGSTLKLMADVTYNSAITVPANTSKTLDLNGKTLSSDTTMIAEGTLTVQSSTAGGNIIHTAKSQVISARNGGTVTVNSGTITGYNADRAVIGGTGTFNLNGGKVVTPASNAFSIQEGSTLNLNAGEIECTSGSTSMGTASAVWAHGNTTINWVGTAIRTNTGNAITIKSAGTGTVSVFGGSFTATNSNPPANGGYAVYNDSNMGTLNLKGNPDFTGKGIYLANDKIINVTGELSNTTPICVTMATPGVFTAGLSGNGSKDNFANGNDGYVVMLNDADEAMLYSADQLAADAVIALIDEIGTVEYTDECKEKIDAAREAYDALTDTQKTLVTNYTTLTTAEAAYDELETEANTVRIGSVDDWNSFADSVKNGNTYSGKTVLLTADVGTVTTMVEGTFSGTFDGDGHMLTVDITGGTVATFQNAANAVFQNFTLAGSVTGSGIHTGALVKSITGGTCSFKNVIVSANVNGAKGYVGGVVAHAGNGFTVSFKNCLYSGSINHTGTQGNFIGAFIGWSQNCTATIENCAFTGSYSNTKSFNNIGFSYNAPRSVTVSDFYSNASEVFVANVNHGTRLYTPGSYTSVEGLVINGDEWTFFAQYSDALSAAQSGGTLLMLDKAVTDAETLIDAIGTVEYTDACKAKIDDARAAYDALTDTQKTLVTNYTTLTDAETSYANLKAAAEAAAALAQAKTDAKAELANYKDPADYRPAQQTELTNAINAGNDAIDAATSTDGVATALENAKAAIDEIKTDAQLTAEENQAAADDVIAKINAIGTVEYNADSNAKIDDARAAYDGLTADQQALVTNIDTLTAAETAYAELEAAAALAAAKRSAKNELLCYKDPADYRPAQQTELTNAINAGNDAIDAAADIAGVRTALANAKTAIDAIKTDAELTAEEAAAALAQAKTDAKAELANYKDPADYRPAQQTELTNAINAGNDAIDAATSTDGVATALENAKAAIDAIKTDAELTEEEEAAALVEKAKDWVSVRIDDQICINFLLAQRDDFESVKIEYIDQDLQTATKTIVYADLSELTIREGHYLVPVVIAPAQIGDTIKATLTVGGQEIVYTMSVKEYCEYLIANYNGENADAVIALAKATLEYGQAANDYFAYSTTTITSPYTAEEKAQFLADAKGAANTLSTTGDIRSKLASAAFMALTQPEFRFYTTGITEAEAVALNDNNQITTNVEGVTAKFYKNGDAILLEVKGIEAKDMDKVITITVGELGTITFSGNDFARMMANSSDQNIAALGAALYLYGDAAKACFA